jgi:XTP/dITP diphosphohydrolase
VIEKEEGTAPQDPSPAPPNKGRVVTVVVVATRNRGKLKEIFALLDAEQMGLELVSINAIAPDTVLVEDEATFEGNALAKARQAAAATGLPALADDSGLEVDALGGAPGVRSARYAGEPSDDARNNAKLVEALGHVAQPGYPARFRCAASYVDLARGLEIVRSGACEGEIVTVARGTQGFGYDPLFLIPRLGRTMAELTVDEKNGLSHRAAAFKALAQALATGGTNLPASPPPEPTRP